MVKYPSGHSPQPNGDTSNNESKTNYGGRGMSLEEKINQSNTYYLTKERAVIHKKPTPIQVVQVDYPHRSAVKITEAYYRQASTTDYNGVYKGKYIDFEAKETKNKTSFPLNNLPEHQREHMSNCIKHGGIAFLLISFKVRNEVYLIPYESIETQMASSNKKSLTYQFIQNNGYLCQTGVFPMLDYLSALDIYLEKLERGN